MSNEDDYAIWWTTQAEVDAVREHFDREELVLTGLWPEYLQREFESRVGRRGRGRLWVSSDLVGAPQLARFHGHGSPLKLFCEHAAGIVIRRADIRTLAHLPGIVTDFDLVRVA